MKRVRLTEEDAYMSFIACGFLVFCALIALKRFGQRRSKTLLFFALTWLFNGLFLLAGGLSTIMLDPFLFKVQYAIMFPIPYLCWMAFLDYAQRDSMGWKKIGVAIGFTMLIFAWVWHPANEIIISTIEIGGVPFIDITIPYETTLLLITDAFTIMFAGSVAYWGGITYKASPVSMRKKTGPIFGIGVALFAASFSLLFIDLQLVDSDTVLLLGILVMGTLLASAVIMAIMIYKEPRIVHLLPYKVYRLLVMSKGGEPYYEFKWTEEEIETVMSAGLLSAISTVANESMKNINTGSISAIQMQNAVMLTDMKFSPVNVALITSKSSNDLQENMDEFTKEFVKVYYNVLYDSEGFVQKVKDPRAAFKAEEMDTLVKKHFANVPSFLETS